MISSRVLTQMYIAMHTADENPFWGPRSYLFTLSQHIRNKTAFTPTSSTHRYAGGTEQIRLKNRMTRHESRRPSPKATGPNVPEAKLQKSHGVSPGLPAQSRERSHARQDVRSRRHPYKEYLDKMCFCPVLDGDGADTYQVSGESECSSQYFTEGNL